MYTSGALDVQRYSNTCLLIEAFSFVFRQVTPIRNTLCCTPKKNQIDVKPIDRWGTLVFNTHHDPWLSCCDYRTFASPYSVWISWRAVLPNISSFQRTMHRVQPRLSLIVLRSTWLIITRSFERRRRVPPDCRPYAHLSSSTNEFWLRGEHTGAVVILHDLPLFGPVNFSVFCPGLSNELVISTTSFRNTLRQTY